jgi:hypothetical protein
LKGANAKVRCGGATSESFPVGIGLLQAVGAAVQYCVGFSLGFWQIAAQNMRKKLICGPNTNLGKKCNKKFKFTASPLDKSLN